MAFFIAAGVISNDVIRRETKKGVLTTFRLKTGAPRGRKLWIDVECWGHLAGTMARYATKDRGISISGRLIQKTWRDKNTGDARHRYMIRAIDIHLHPLDEALMTHIPNSVILKGRIETIYPDRPTSVGATSCIQVRSGSPRDTAGSLEIDVELWYQNETPVYGLGYRIPITGSLSYRKRIPRLNRGNLYISGQLWECQLRFQGTSQHLTVR